MRMLWISVLVCGTAIADPFDAPNPHERGSHWRFSTLDSVHGGNAFRHLGNSATLCFDDYVEVEGSALKGRWAGAGRKGTYRVDPPSTLRHVRVDAGGYSREVLVFFFRRKAGGEFDRDKVLGHSSLWGGVQAVSGVRLGWCP